MHLRFGVCAVWTGSRKVELYIIILLILLLFNARRKPMSARTL